VRRVNPLSLPTSSTRVRDRSSRRLRRPPRTRCLHLVVAPRPAALSRTRERVHSSAADPSHRRTPGRDHLPTPCHSLWRITLRRFPLASSRTASPRPLPSRRQSLPHPRRVATTKIKEPPRPQGLAPLPSPLRGPVLPPHLARSSLGLAFQIEPDPEANRRPVGPPGQARRRCPPPKHASGGETPPDRTPTAPIGQQTTRERRSCRPEADQPPSAAAHGGRDGSRSPEAEVGRSPTRFRRCSRIKVDVSDVLTTAQPDGSWGPAEATTRPTRGSQPDLGVHRTEVRALHPCCAAEAMLRPKPREGSARPPGGQALSGV